MRTVALPWLLTCAVCGDSFAAPRRAARAPVVCSDTCRAERGPHGDVRLSRRAATGTGVWDYTTGERHSSDSGDPAHELLIGSGAGGYLTTAGYLPVRDGAGEYVRDDSGRVVTRFRNFEAESNMRPEGATEPYPVIGQSDLPWDWQDRLDRGESIEDMRVDSWLGEPVERWLSESA